MPSITVLDSAGVTQTVQTIPAVGSALSAASLPVVIASDQPLWPATQPVSISGTVSVSGTFFQATQPVSLTVLPALATGGNVIGAVTQSGTWNVTVSNASLAVTGTFFQATQPVSAASLPLPTGAATSAKQPALGVAGTASTDVITVQGIASGTAQPVSIASMPSTPVTGTFWQATQPVSFTQQALPANQSVNAAQINGVTPLMGNGITGTGSLRVTIASDNTAFSVNAVQSGTWNIGTIATLPALVAGTALIGKVGIDQTTPGTTNLVSIGTNGTVSIAAAQTIAVTQATASSLNVTTTPVTPTPFSLSSAATTNATSVKASAGTLYTLAVSNGGAAAAFLKLYNKASAPTVGTDVPALTIPIAASSVQSLNLGETGHRFATGIALAITNLVADSDTTAVVAAQVKVLLDYI